MKRRLFLGSMVTGLFTGAVAKARSYYRLNIPDTIPTINGQIYTGPAVTQILVEKRKKKMYLLNGKKTLKKYKVKFGFAPVGHKVRQGDGKTPEGLYYLDRRNFDSSFYLSLGISYPNARDKAYARSIGVNPGGDIFIHGLPNDSKKAKRLRKNWTAGCISVSDIEMREIFWMTRLGTPIYIKAK